MAKKRKLRPFYRRLTRRIGIAQFIVMALASYLIYLLAEDTAKDEQLETYKGYLDVTKKDVDRIISDVSVGTKNHVPEIEEHLDHPDRLFDLMERVVELNPQIRSCGLSFVADYYPQKGHWFCPYAVRREDGTIARSTIGDAQHDYLKADWFVEALKADSSYWSKPFFESNDTIVPLVSYMIPIHNKQGKTVAILGADLSLTWFGGNLMRGRVLRGDDSNSIKVNIHSKNGQEYESEDGQHYTFREVLEYGCYTFIINHEGTYIAHPDSGFAVRKNYFELAKETNDSIDDHVGHLMVKRMSGIYSDAEGDECHLDFFDFREMDVYMCYQPIEHTDWSIALVVPRVIIDVISIAFGVIFLILIGLALLVVRFVGKFVAKHATRPLSQLAASANEVAKGNFNAPLPKLKHNDEIRQLRDSFEEMQHSLTHYIDELTETTASKAAIENELKVAHDIQMSMLPKTFPPYPERTDIDIFGSLKPAKDVGGDLFDFYISNERLFFCIGDVSGKGVPASLFMAMTRSLFRNISMHVSEPEHIVTALNAAMTDGNDTSMFVTLFLGVLDLSTGDLAYCNAGHDAPLLIGQDVTIVPCAPNLPIGVMADWEYTAQQTRLNPQATIFLFTDGLNEAENIDHAQFGDERIIQLAKSLAADGLVQPDVVITHMDASVRTFVGTAEQSDDLTMLAIQYHGQPPLLDESLGL